MSTSPPSGPPPGVLLEGQSRQMELTVYSHSTMYYWWPVWFVSFIMVAWTYIDGGRAYLLPGTLYPLGGAYADAKRDWRVEDTKDKGIEIESREGIILHKGKHLPPSRANADGGFPKPEEPLMMAQSKNPGVLWTATLLLIILLSNVSFRGLWSIIVVISIILLVVLFAFLDWWGPILDALSLLRIHINFGGYLFFGAGLLATWLAIFFVYDRRKYMVFTAGQVRVCLEVGEGEKIYDTTGMVFLKQQNDFFRHWVIGLGAGDLIVKTSGAHSEVFDLPNVMFVGWKIKQIEQMLKSREVV